MKITSTGASARGAYYDRNMTSKYQQSDTGAIAPATSTTRWFYTVPTGRKAFIGAWSSTIIRVTVATTPLFFDDELTVNDGVTSGTFDENGSFSNVAGFTQMSRVGGGYVMPAGANTGSFTADASTGGTNRFFGGCVINEFDA